MFKKKKLSNFFDKAYDYVKNNPCFCGDIKYTQERSPEDFKKWTSQRFMWQYAWVVYNAGFRQKTIKGKFDAIEKAFCDFDLDKICAMKSLDAVLKVFNNKRKAKCVLEGAKIIREKGFEEFKKSILKEAEEKRPEILRELPGIGNITKDHLAKDIGVTDVHKKDRHIQRLAALLADKKDEKMIQYLVQKNNDRLKDIYLKKALTDSILFRFCEQKAWKQQGYKSLRSFIVAL